jgi:hypothetical protein
VRRQCIGSAYARGRPLRPPRPYLSAEPYSARRAGTDSRTKISARRAGAAGRTSRLDHTAPGRTYWRSQIGQHTEMGQSLVGHVHALQFSEVTDSGKRTIAHPPTSAQLSCHPLLTRSTPTHYVLQPTKPTNDMICRKNFLPPNIESRRELTKGH